MSVSTGIIKEDFSGAEIGAAYEAGKQTTQVVELPTKFGDLKVLVTHDQAAVHTELMEKLLPAPLRCEKTVYLDDARSFADYVNDFSDDNTAIFIDKQNGKFVAVLDYHHSTEKPRFGNHIANYICPKSKEWGVWLENSGRKMSQQDFALFIEDNADEIQKPSSAEMLEIASSLKADIKTEFRSAQRLDNGQVQFVYNEVINGQAGSNGQLTIPQEIEVILTPFNGGPSYTRTARFRYRIKDGQLLMWYDLVRPHKVLEAAVDDTMIQIKQQIKGCRFYMGKP